jgi:aspartyl-tRNA(Asn)/glutamyl-tRNA(Gln) amidotransferase subunit B
VSHQAARKIYADLVSSGDEPRDAAVRLGLVQVREKGALVGWVDEVIAAHPAEVERYRGGESRLLGFLTGQVMKRSQGQDDPKRVQPLLQKRLEAK